MRPICRFFLCHLIFAGSILMGATLLVRPAEAQDAPSLGDVARQARQKKQQQDAPTKDTATADAPASSSTSPNSQTNASSSNAAQAKGGQAKDVQAKDVQTKDAQTKDAQGKDAQTGTQLKKASHVFTNDDLPSQAVAGVKPAAATTSQGKHAPDPAFGGKMSADDVRQAIQDQKEGIAALEARIKEVNDSIHFTGNGCVDNCAQWNEEQQEKQRQVENMRDVLEGAKQGLEQMQDYARKMGYGSSVYDPE